MGFERIAIVNRGEPAMRLIHAARDLSLETGRRLTTIALFTDPDRGAMYVRNADEAHHLGPALVTGPDGGRRVAYVDHGILQEALTAVKADAVWAGWGFVAEQAGFVEMCEQAGITFIGPASDVMRQLGDKITSKLIAERAGVPVAAWSGGPVETVEEAHAAAAGVGYPLLIKATAGGGGRGIRRVDGPDALAESFASARREAASAFGDPTVFLERLMPSARHVEVQVIGDLAGTVWSVGVRDCTVQRKNQKIVEEAPSPALTEVEHREVLDAARRLAATAGYSNAGTVEFLFDRASRRFAFMEVNARLQVEHPITEITTGVDLVKLQLHVASGGLLDPEPPPTVGHAIEVRVNAEDPERDFRPAPGVLEVLRFGTGPGLRVDTGVEEGDEVAPQFDSMIAKVIAWGRDRPEALARLRRGLEQSAIALRDGTTNKAFLMGLLGRDEIATGDYDTGWIDRLTATGGHLPTDDPAAALVAAAITAYDEEVGVAIRAFAASAARGRPEVGAAVGRTVSLSYRGHAYQIAVRRLDPVAHRLEVDGTVIDAEMQQLAGWWRLSIGDRTHRVLCRVHAGVHLVEVDGIPYRFTHAEGGIIRSPSPSVVVSVLVAPGDRVEAGDRMAVIEAMKMESTLLAEAAGTVREIAVRPNQQVTTGQPIVIMDLEEEAAGGDVGPGRIDFSALASADAEVDHNGCARALVDLRRLVLGYDVDPGRGVGIVAPACTDDLDPQERRRHEEEILRIFTDVLALYRRRPVEEEETARRSFEEYLFDFLKDSTRRGQGLPQPFLDQLRRTLGHHGPAATEPGPQQESALYRLAVSHERLAEAAIPVLEILEGRAEAPAAADDAFRHLLDRLATESLHTFPAIHDLAQEVRYRAFDAPFLERVRAEALRHVEEQLSALAEGLDGPDRRARIDALVASPLPLAPLLAAHHVAAGPALRRALLETMVRRYYRIRPLDEVTTAEHEALPVASTEYDLDGERIRAVAIRVEWAGLAAGAAAVGRLLDGMGASPDTTVVDLYAWREEGIAGPGLLRDTAAEALADALGDRALRRVVVTVSGPESSAQGMGGVLNLTFRPDGRGGYEEAGRHRDLHPMMVKRLELWRLEENFDLQRIPSLEDIYVFRGVARSNPRDERLFTIAEVRDATPVRDGAGRVVAIPDLERVFHEAIGSIRRFQARRPPDRRLVWNRLLLYIWPDLELDHEEIQRLVRRLTPDAVGLGLQKVVVLAHLRSPGSAQSQRVVVEAADPEAGGFAIRIRTRELRPLEPLGDYEQRVVRLQMRGLTYPYELVKLLAPSGEDAHRGFPPGRFIEHELVDGALNPVDRPPGQNTANVVVGIIESRTDRYPEGMRRVAILSDPSRGMGNLAEPECSRIIAALDLAEAERLPVEWFAVSAGALISMDSGTENMDWIARVLRRLIEFTQAGHEVNVIVCGINVGAQPYWNAEATMLMHTKGILVMTPEGAMVLTGKEALDYSGGVSAEDNLGIGGYERIMGPNGQAQYFAPSLVEACRILLRHYEHSYVAPGERFPRRGHTGDPATRNAGLAPHGGEFATVGEVFSDEHNPGRKKPFEIRRVMAAVVDQDHTPLERWYGMQGAEVAVVWDAMLGGRPVCLIGLESKPMTRTGFVPADGPLQWTSGTLFPRSSKKVARALNAASGNRPAVVLANLSGFDGSPESLRNLQLEYGAEIGRAVVNFDGPIVFCVVSRYHGGAFVVFSAALNDGMEVAAIDGSHASVIGGAPAAAVVFSREVDRRTESDPRVRELAAQVVDADGLEKSELRARLLATTDEVRAEKLGEVAAEFDAVHSVERALEVGSIHRIIPASEVRPYLIDAVERGIGRVEGDRGP